MFLWLENWTFNATHHGAPDPQAAGSASPSGSTVCFLKKRWKQLPNPPCQGQALVPTHHHSCRMYTTPCRISNQARGYQISTWCLSQDFDNSWMRRGLHPTYESNTPKALRTKQKNQQLTGSDVGVPWSMDLSGFHAILSALAVGYLFWEVSIWSISVLFVLSQISMSMKGYTRIF